MKRFGRTPFWCVGAAAALLAIGTAAAFRERMSRHGAAPTSGLLFDATEYDAGTVKGLGNPRVNHAFRFTNVSAHPVRIVRIGTSCGCTGATSSRTVVSPAESGEITAGMRLGSVGENRNEIAVYTDASEAPVRLTLAATFLPDAFTSVFPAKVELSRDGEEPAAFRVDAFTLSREVPRVLSVAAAPDIFEATVEAARRSTWRAGAGYFHTIYQGSVRRAGLPAAGPVDGTVTVRFTPPTVPPAELLVSLSERPAITVSPSKVLFVVSGDAPVPAAEGILIRPAPGASASLVRVENPLAAWLDARPSAPRPQGELAVELRPTRRPPAPSDGAIGVVLQMGEEQRTVLVPVFVRLFE